MADNVDRLRQFAAQRQAVTTFGDEVSLELATIGAEFGLTVDQIEKAVVAVQDRSLALGRGPLELMRVIARFGGGVSDSLIDVGLVVDKNADRAEEFTRAMAEMTSGMSEMVANLPTSALTKLGNTLGDLQEGLGKVISSTGTFQTIVRVVEGAVSKLNQALDNREVLEEVLAAIDGFVVGVVNAFAKLATEVLLFIASILDAVGALVAGLQLAGVIDSFEVLTNKVLALQQEMDSLDPTIEGNSAKLEILQADLVGLQAQLARSARVSDISGDAFRSMAVRIGEGAQAFQESVESAGHWIQAQEDIFEALQKVNEAMADRTANVRELSAAEEEQIASFENFVAALQAQGEGIGQALQVSIADAFDRDVGLEEAVSNLGQRMKFTLIDNFSQAALSPIRASFGALATAAAQPFELVGNIINKTLIAPLTNIVTSAIASIVEQLFGLVVAQEVIAATGLAGLAAVAAGASAVGSAWGAAAVAASIATLGGALAAVPGALGAISSGAALTQALSVPKLAEGGVVRARPGGVLVNVAEGGQDEAVIPLDQGMPRMGIEQHFHFHNRVGGSASEIAREVSDEFLFTTRNRSIPRGMGALI